MKKILLAAILILAACVAHAQSTLTTKDGDTLKVYNVDVSGTAIYYTLTNDHDASIRRMEKIYVNEIKTRNGDKYDLETGEIVWQAYPSRLYTINDEGITYVVNIDSLAVNYKTIPEQSAPTLSIEKSKVYKIERADGSLYDLGTGIPVSTTQTTTTPTTTATTTPTTGTTTTITTVTTTSSTTSNTTQTSSGSSSASTVTTTNNTGIVDTYSGIFIEYMFGKNMWGIAYNGIAKYVDLGAAMFFFKGDSYDDQTNFKFRLGGNYSVGYDPFNISLAAGFHYTHTQFKFSGYDSEYKDNYCGLYILPRFILQLGTNFGLTFGYHWDMIFKSGYGTDKYGSVGLVFGGF